MESRNSGGGSNSPPSQNFPGSTTDATHRHGGLLTVSNFVLSYIPRLIMGALQGFAQRDNASAAQHARGEAQSKDWLRRVSPTASEMYEPLPMPLSRLYANHDPSGDEKKPQCTNCESRKKACKYASAPDPQSGTYAEITV